MTVSPAKARFLRLQGLFSAGKLEEAQREVASALKTASKDPNLLHLAAQIADAQADRPRAIMLFRKALKANPDWMEAEYNLARTLADEGEFREAVSLMETICRKRPDLPVLAESLAKIHQRAKDLPKAIAAWEKAQALQPDNPSFASNAALLRAEICDWSRRPTGAEPMLPQAVVVFCDNPQAQKQAATLYAQKTYAAIRPLPPRAKEERGILRIGYLSSDYQAHATSWLMAELFELHDRTRFHVTAYSTGPDDSSPIRKRIESGVDRFVDLTKTRSPDAAATIRNDGTDILVDLKGYTRGNRFEIMAFRPAPLQIHWLGYPGTLGAPFIDLFVGDPVVLPPSQEANFSEKILRLPDSYQINDRKRSIGCIKPRSAYGLPQNAVILASFNQTYKITPEQFDLWCKILRERPETVLWLLESNPQAADTLRREAETRGIGGDRLHFAKPCPQDEHLARYHCVDLALDTYPVGGHTTTSDALWVGTPVVTRLGPCFVSRVAASLLCAANLPHLIAQDQMGYFETALRLIDQKALRDQTTKHLRDKRDTLPLFDTPRFVTAWESALQKAWSQKNG